MTNLSGRNLGRRPTGGTKRQRRVCLDDQSRVCLASPPIVGADAYPKYGIAIPSRLHYKKECSGGGFMGRSTEVSTACLDVTLQVNAVWVKQGPRHNARHRAREASMQSAGAGTATGSGAALASITEEGPAEDETMLLCSDIICVDDELRAQPEFDTTSYVMAQAIAHTQRFCTNQGVRIRAFRSVEVLRMVQPGLPASFLFLFEAIIVT
jgi:hypothetical protein